MADPVGVTGCKAWWSFDDISLLYEDVAGTNQVDVDGDFIFFAWDRSGNSRHLNGDVNAPAYKTGILNGLSVARFDGANDYLFANTVFSGDTSWTIFIVAKKRGAIVATQQHLFSGSNVKMGFFTATGSLSSTGYNYYANQAVNEVVIGGTPADTNIICARIASASSMTVRLNGGSPVATFDPDDVITGSTEFFLATNWDFSENGDYDIGEVVLYDTALSDADLDLVGNYLERWGATWADLTAPATPPTTIPRIGKGRRAGN